jgi:tetratricopeptide (TPR) repeat protein
MVRGFRVGPRRLVVAVVALLTWLPGRSVLADQDSRPVAGRADELDRLVNEGIALRNTGQPATALERFKRACELERSARTLGHLGLAEVELKQWLRAEEDLQASLAAKDSEWLRQHRQMLEKQLDKVRPHIGELAIIGPVGATVFVDGQRVGALPMSKALRVGEGPVVVTAQAEGLPPLRETATVTGGGVATVELAATKAVTAGSDVDQEIERLADQAYKLRTARPSRNLEAYDLLRKAYGLKQTAMTLLALAAVEHGMGRWEDAESHFVAGFAAPDPTHWLDGLVDSVLWEGKGKEDRPLVLVKVQKGGKPKRWFMEQNLIQTRKQLEHRKGNPDVEAWSYRGWDLRKEKNPPAELDAFKRAYAIEATPRTLAQLAVAKSDLGSFAESAELLAQARASASDPWIMKWKQELDEVESRNHAHLLPDRSSLPGDPPAGLPALPPGQHWVEARRVDDQGEAIDQPFWTGPRIVGAVAVGTGALLAANGARLLLRGSGGGCAEEGPAGFGCLSYNPSQSTTPGKLWLGAGLLTAAIGTAVFVFYPAPETRVVAVIGPGNFALGGTW